APGRLSALAVALVRAVARVVGLENRNKAQGAGRRAVADFAVITFCGKQHPYRDGFGVRKDHL
ncbi:MAG: hypothetical protein WCD78_21495, partial [Pseudolabrys sp.]